MSWSDLGDWWTKEVTSDAAYESVVTPLLFEVFSPMRNGVYLDLGAGEGRIMRTMSDLGMSVVGVDLNEDLAAASDFTVVVAETPPIPMRDDSVDGVYSVLALEHIVELAPLLMEAARVTRARGVLAVVINHPMWTAPDSTPITAPFSMTMP